MRALVKYRRIFETDCGYLNAGDLDDLIKAARDRAWLRQNKVVDECYEIEYDDGTKRTVHTRQSEH
mgnify:CR=1 FL=1